LNERRQGKKKKKRIRIKEKGGRRKGLLKHFRGLNNFRADEADRAPCPKKKIDGPGLNSLGVGEKGKVGPCQLVDTWCPTGSRSQGSSFKKVTAVGPNQRGDFKN